MKALPGQRCLVTVCEVESLSRQPRLRPGPIAFCHEKPWPKMRCVSLENYPPRAEPGSCKANDGLGQVASD